MFRFHWKEESQHAVLDELEWQREDAHARRRRSATAAVDDLIELVGAVDGILQAQSAADAGYFMRLRGRAVHGGRERAIRETVLKAYRWQYIVSGCQHPHLMKLLGGMVTQPQMRRIRAAVAPIIDC